MPVTGRVPGRGRRLRRPLRGASSSLAGWYVTVGVGLAIGVKLVWSAAALEASTGQRRGQPLGILIAGVGLAVGPPVIQALIEAVG